MKDQRLFRKVIEVGRSWPGWAVRAISRKPRARKVA
jgi:hypothetical protein